MRETITQGDHAVEGKSRLVNGSAIVILPYATTEWVNLAQAVAQNNLKDYSDRILLDISKLSYPCFATIKVKPPKDLFQQTVTIRKPILASKSISFAIPNDEAFSQSISIRGAHEGKIFNFLARREVNAAKLICQQVSLLLQNFRNVNAVVIPNGRLLYQRLIENFFRTNTKCDLFFYEKYHHGFTRLDELNLDLPELTTPYFFENFPVHSRKKIQDSISGKKLSPDPSREIFRKWFLSRAGAQTSSNPFGSDFDPYDRSDSMERVPGEPVDNYFFTSSSDEIVGMGSDWHGSSWIDQYHAFDEVLSALERQAESNFTLRVHPNLRNKSTSHVLNEIRRIKWLSRRHPTLQIIGPMSNANSYKLMAEAKRVIVSNSIVSVEASGMGVPVWGVSPSKYDLSVDMRHLYSPEHLGGDSLDIFEVDKTRTYEFVESMIAAANRMKFEDQQNSGHFARFRSIIGVQPSYAAIVAFRRFEVIVNKQILRRKF